MLKARSGRCPYCGYENDAQAVACAECGAPLSWSDTLHQPARPPRKAPKAAQAAPTAAVDTPRPARDSALAGQAIVSPGLLKLMGAFIGLCLLTVVGVSYRFGIALPFLPEREEAINIDASHGASVQDAETYRLLTFNAARAPATDESYSPEGLYIVSINMPHTGDVLEITVNSSWNLLDYKTRLQYANNLAKRWQKVHAPYRAAFTIYDLSGKECGGRSAAGVMWVQQEQATGFDVPSLLARDISGAQTILGAPQSEATPGPADSNGIGANGWKQWQRDDKTLLAAYRSGGQIGSIYVSSSDPTRKASDKSRLLDMGNLQANATLYRVVFMHALEAPRRYAGVKAIINPFGGKLPDNGGSEAASHSVTYHATGAAQSATVFYINTEGKTVRTEGVHLPWQKTVAITGSPVLWMAADNEWLGQGEVSAEITVDGKSIAKDNGQDAAVYSDLSKVAGSSSTPVPVTNATPTAVPTTAATANP